MCFEAGFPFEALRKFAIFSVGVDRLPGVLVPESSLTASSGLLAASPMALRPFDG